MCRAGKLGVESVEGFAAAVKGENVGFAAVVGYIIAYTKPTNTAGRRRYKSDIYT